jgi:hypothetical protein
MDPFTYQRCGPRNLKILSQVNNKNIQLTFDNLTVTSVDLSDPTKKYIYITANLAIDKYREMFQYIMSIDDRIEEVVGSDKKVYLKSAINGDKLKLKIPYRYGNFEVNTNALISDLFPLQDLHNVVIELNNVYIIDKHRYFITGPIWLLKSFEI